MYEPKALIKPLLFKVQQSMTTLFYQTANLKIKGTTKKGSISHCMLTILHTLLSTKTCHFEV